MREALRSGETARSAFGTMLLVILVLGAVGLVTTGFHAGPLPSLELRVRPEALGPRTHVEAVATGEGRGLTEVRLELVQGDKVKLLGEEKHASRPAYAFWGARTTRVALTRELGREALEGLTEGPATLRLVATRASTWLRAPDPGSKEITAPVRLKPPSLLRRTSPVYATSGGAGAVVYEVGPTSVRDGVAVGDLAFPGFPLPGGGEKERFALFGIPYDVADRRTVRLFAEDDVGNRIEAPALDKLTAKAFPADTIDVRDDFLAKVVPEILGHAKEVKDQGDPLKSFLAINRDLRRANAETLRTMAAASARRFLWSRSFMPMTGAKVMSAFADRRSYVYRGSEVDQQTHLGFDLAATRNTPVPAGNDGTVALAEYFGIYGNTVVLDHGYGVMSLYAHLSAIDVAKGQSVARGDVLGRTGATGLAGGDHLHFTLLVQGLPVDPREWWDAHWIRDRVAAALGPALPFTD